MRRAGTSVNRSTAFATILTLIASLCFSACSGKPKVHNRQAHHPSIQTAQRPERYIVVGPAPGEAAPIRFEFPPPEDAYRGEVRRVRGELLLGAARRGPGARGWFEVDVTDVTMGDADLDENVRFNIEFLEGRRFPLARYDVDHVIEVQEPERLVTLVGRFTLKGRTVPLQVEGRIRPAGDENGPYQWVFETSWTLDRLSERFNIIGPGSPVADEDEPSGRPGDRLNFHLHVFLQRVGE